MPKISIIVPVYNAEQYIHHCVRSILSQTSPDFELILVNDGSSDNSGTICDEYATMDSRIIVVHQENHGASAARNRGLDYAKGNYVVFCDSDDMVAPQWLEHLLYSAAPDTLSVCSLCHNESQLGAAKELPIDANICYSHADYFLFSTCGIGGYMCNSMYDNRIILEKHLRLRERKECGDYNEDLLFNLQYVENVANIVYVGYADYLYNIHADSLSRANTKYHFEKYAEKYALWKAFLVANHREDQLSTLASMYLYHFLTALNGESYVGFRKIVHSPEVQHCLTHVQDSDESSSILKLIRNKNTFALWIKYKLHEMKGKLS